MSSKRYSEEQIIGVLKEIDSVASMAGVARVHGIGELVTLTANLETKP
jgi:hypothetical protein